MNRTLFRASIKAHWALAIGFAAFVLIYVLTSVSMFEPGSADSFKAMMEMLPESMVKAFGFDKLSGELTDYLANYLYGFIFLVFPLIYGVIIANNLVAKHVDRGSMAYLLTTPNNRKKIISTQFLYMVFSIIAIFIIDVGMAILMCEIMFKGQLAIGSFLCLNIVTVLTTIAIASICFVISCIFNESKISILFGTGISVGSIIMHMLSSLGEKTEFLKYFSLHTFVDINKSLYDGSYVFIISMTLILIILALYFISIKIFDKRNLIL